MISDNPIILLSYTNTKLRDEYSSLEAMCDDLDIDVEELVKKLKNEGYIYSKEQNQFIKK